VLAFAEGGTMVVASQNPDVHDAADWILKLRDGRSAGIVDQLSRKPLLPRP
jgi:hypothetical protein